MADEKSQTDSEIGDGIGYGGCKNADEAGRLASLVYQHSSEAITVTDADGAIISVNPAFTIATGYRADEVIGRNHRIISSGRQDRAFYSEMWRAIHETGSWQGEIWNRRKNGEIYAEWLTVNTVFNDDGTVYRYIGMFSDITRKKQTDDLIWRQANYDGLTSLPNRHLFRERLEQEAHKTDRIGTPLALMFLDLDYFKDVNDTLGHDMGDQLLKEAALRLRACVRGIDTVARLGGDEFTILLGDLHDTAVVERLAQDILRKLSEPFQLGGNRVSLTASIGVALYPADTADIDSLIKYADQAMYAAKGQGRNCCTYFTPSMQELAQTRMHLTSDLRLALGSDQFVVYYQPIVDLATGEACMAEALLRWRHPARGLIGPDQFVPIAEETGMIVDIGNLVFREAARQVQRLRAMHCAGFQISLNQSPAQFHGDEELYQDWFDYMQKLNIPGESIVIEITESLLANISPEVAKKLHGLRAAGLQVSLDDFGTARSSLAALKKFDINCLKIDQQFVRSAAPDERALCEAMIVMAHKLGLKVIAEGVETEAQREFLVAAGCDYGQGYLFSRPLPRGEFESMLAARGRPEKKVANAHRRP